MPELPVSRRRLLQMSGLGFGNLALAHLLASEGRAATGTVDLKPRATHFEPQAKAVIQFIQSGGPSQMDLFDPKPMLTKMAGKPHPDGVEIHQPNNKNTLLPSPFEFKRYGQSGMDISEVLPHLPSIVDELTFIRSMQTEHNNHLEGLNMMLTCKIHPGRPVFGAWVSYALGTVSQNLPAYVVLRDPGGYPVGSRQLWASGYLPALFQGVEFNTKGVPVHYLAPPQPLPPGVQRETLNLLAEMNKDHASRHPGESELDARIENFELAARMQLAAPDVLDVSKESEATRKLYGLDDPVTEPYGTRCLMARRLIEAGVRFVQIFPTPGQPWDHHDKLPSQMRKMCAETDKPVVALVKDLKERGLLGTTIVQWTGEFGRLPTTQNGDGRDHNRNAFTMWLAGGGLKPGLIHGATDDFGYKAVVDRVSTPDLMATLLHQLGLDHRKLQVMHGGRVETPSDVTVTGAKVRGELLSRPVRVSA